MKQSSLPFSSIFADEMRQYLELAESADKVTESYYYTFKRLDDFIVKQNYQEKILSADIQYAWINTLDTSSRSRAGEASRLRQFARYQIMLLIILQTMKSPELLMLQTI